MMLERNGGKAEADGPRVAMVILVVGVRKRTTLGVVLGGKAMDV